MKYLALLRGINVGGKTSLPMQALTALLEEAGASNVRTYIQSGNAVLEHPSESGQALAEQLAEAIGKAFAFSPAVMVLRAEDLLRVIANNPFPEAQEHGSTLHVGFLAAAPSAAKRDKLEALCANGERYLLTEDSFYLHAPAGIGKSKLAAGAERAIGVAMTMRNWNTLVKLQEMCR